MKISPIFYMGNKKRLIQKGLVELFPIDINKFIDLFGGSGIISMNTKANSYYINDIDEHLVDLYTLFKNVECNQIISHIERRIDEFGLPKEDTNRTKYQDKQKIEEYKKAYMSFRNKYNSEKNTLDFYTLIFFAFSQQFRFNNKGEFNMPCGNNYFSEKNKEYIIDGCNFFKQSNVCIGKGDFRNLNIELLSIKDFIYLDPPYLNTTATYNENGGWNIQDEKDLYKLCEDLNSKGIKFGLSNVFTNKGIQNEMLIEWCDTNNWNVHTLNSMTYHACGKGDSKSKEVFITNYK